MALINRYIVTPTSTFKIELKNIVNYFIYKLKEPTMADKFYNNVYNQINSLNFMPRLYARVFDYSNRKRNLHRMIIDRYVIIYEVKRNTRQVFILHIFHCSQNYLNKL